MSSLKQWKILISVPFLLIHTLGWAGKGHELPRLDTDAEKLATLLEIRKHIPSLFSDAAAYDADLFTLLENERELLEKLKKIPKYNELFSQKKYFSLTVKPPAEGLMVGSVEIKPEAVEAWKESVREIAKKTQEEGVSNPADLPSRVQNLLNSEQITLISEAQNQLGGLGKIDQGASAEVKSKQRLLNECLKEKSQLKRYECIESRFNELQALPGFIKHGFTASKNSQLIAALKAEEKRNKLLNLLAVTHRAPGRSPLNSWDEVEAVINGLDADRLIHLNDKEDALKPIIDEALNHPSEAELNRALTAAYDHVYSFAAQTNSHQKKVAMPLIINQVLPQIGIFRGFAGGDCSSQYSFPYPNSPHELVFFIEDLPKSGAEESEKKLKGYVSATQVTLPNGEKALYVITISGKRVSAGDTELILRALEDKKKDLGVSHIVLPTPDRLAGLINFPEIRGVFESHIKNKPQSKINHEADSDIRSIIEGYRPESGFNGANYDHQANNTQGIILEFKKNLVTVNTTENEDLPFNVQPLSGYSNQELVEFLMELNHSNRSQTFKKVLEIDGVSKRFNNNLYKNYSITSFFEFLKSCDEPKVSINQFEYKTLKILNGLGIDGEQFLKKHQQFLYPGIAHCNDSYEPKYIERVSKYIVNDFQKNNYEPKGIQLWKLSEASLLALQKSNQFIQMNGKLASSLSTGTDAYVRAAAAFALGRIKPADPEIHKALANYLLDSDASVRSSVVVALVQIKPADPEIHKALENSLRDADARVRSSVADALGQIKPADAEIHKALANSLLDSDARVRSSVESAISRIRIRDRDSIKIMLEIANSAAPEVSRNSRQALRDIFHLDFGHLDSSNSSETLLQKESTFLSELLLLVSSPNQIRIKRNDSKIRSKLARALGVIEPSDPEIIQELLELLKDSDLEVRESAFQSLRYQSLDPGSLQAAFETIRGPNNEASERALQALYEMKPNDPSIQGELISALQDGDPKIRAFAVNGLLGAGKENLEIQKSIVRALSDSDAKVQSSALWILGRIRPKNPEIQKVIIEFLKKTKPSNLETDFLVKLLENHNREIRSWALNRLALVPGKDITSNYFWIRLLKNPDALVRHAAAKELKKILPFSNHYQSQLVDKLRDSDPQVRSWTKKALKFIYEESDKKEEINQCLESSSVALSHEKIYELLKIMEATKSLK